jgi:hypothetical protein
MLIPLQTGCPLSSSCIPHLKLNSLLYNIDSRVTLSDGVGEYLYVVLTGMYM